MHTNRIRDFAQCERVQILHAAFKEVALLVNDVVHHFEHRLTALLQRLNHPVGGIQFAGNKVLALTIELLLVARDFLIHS